MARIPYNIAKELLTDGEKDRVLACYLTISNPNDAVDFDAAAQDFGAASTQSFKKMLQTAWKKVQKSADENGMSSEHATGNLDDIPKKGRQGRKRKAAGDVAGIAVQPVPKKPSRKGRAQKVKAENIDSEDEADVGGGSTPTMRSGSSPLSEPASSPGVGSGDHLEDNITLSTDNSGTDIKTEE